MRAICVLLAALLAGCAGRPFPESDFRAAYETAYRARVEGPAVVSLAGKTTLRVQSGQAWVPTAQGAPLLRAIGMEPHPEMLGLLVNAVRDPMVAIVYARDRRVPELPEVGLAGRRDAPDLAGFRPR